MVFFAVVVLAVAAVIVAGSVAVCSMKMHSYFATNYYLKQFCVEKQNGGNSAKRKEQKDDKPKEKAAEMNSSNGGGGRKKRFSMTFQEASDKIKVSATTLFNQLHKDMESRNVKDVYSLSLSIMERVLTGAGDLDYPNNGEYCC